MADKILRLKIDVTKIDKARLFKGEKGTYLDCTLLYNEATDQYGNNGMITQDVSKEDREAGNKGAILGNAKEFKQQGSAPVKVSTPASLSDDIPF
jgi:hypothetical protein